MTRRAGRPVRCTTTTSRLSHAALASDFVMIASQDQSALAQNRQANKESGQTLCAAYSSEGFIETVPRDQAQQYADSSERFSCVTDAARRRRRRSNPAR